MASCIVALVLFGEDSTVRIAQALKKLRIEYRVVPYDRIPNFTYTHIILSGGPKHVYMKDHYPLPKWVIDSDTPVLGICYGMQIIAYSFGGIVKRMNELEKGPVDVTELINGYQITSTRWMNRNDQVTYLPKTFTITGVTNKNHIAAFTDNVKYWAVQYHPESRKNGDLSIFKRFVNSCKPF